MTIPPRIRLDLLVTTALLIGLIAWDVSGADLSVVRLFADLDGFVERDSWWASTLLHSGGRWAAWGLAAGLLVVAIRTPTAVARGPGRSERALWLGTMFLCALTVPAMKGVSLTSCPWDLTAFGGVARYVSHWRLGVPDGGPGHCFPAGHAVAAFAFLGMYFLWREHHAGRARLWLAGVLGLGVLFGFAQLARGAHYVSHTLWSAWICWVIGVAASAAFHHRTARLNAAGSRPKMSALETQGLS